MASTQSNKTCHNFEEVDMFFTQWSTYKLEKNSIRLYLHHFDHNTK